MFEVKVGTVSFSSPLILASGRITETPEFFLASREFGCASMVTRSLREFVRPERVRTPAPRYAIIDRKSMLNCEWGNEYPWTRWRDEWVRKVKNTRSPLILSLSGRELESCIHLVREFDEVGVDAYEINVSCSHSGALHGNLNVDVDRLKQLLATVRPITSTPIWVKLSYSHLLLLMAKVAEEYGADAIVCTNTIGPGLLLDIEGEGRPVLGAKGGVGGLSGRAIFPIALRCVYELVRTVQVPVVGVGGIWSTEDVVQMLMAGASAVQLYTAPSFAGPRIFGKIMKGLSEYLAQHSQYESASSIIGTAQKWVDQSTRFDAPPPVIDMERCIGCGDCEVACHFDAIQYDAGKRYIGVQCVACNACIGLCPEKAIAGGSI